MAFSWPQPVAFPMAPASRSLLDDVANVNLGDGIGFVGGFGGARHIHGRRDLDVLHTCRITSGCGNLIADDESRGLVLTVAPGSDGKVPLGRRICLQF